MGSKGKPENGGFIFTQKSTMKKVGDAPLPEAFTKEQLEKNAVVSIWEQSRDIQGVRVEKRRHTLFKSHSKAEKYEKENFQGSTRVTTEKDAKKSIKEKMAEAKLKTKEEGVKFGVINGEVENMTLTNTTLDRAMADDFDDENSLRAELKKEAEQRKIDFKDDYEKLKGQLMYIKSLEDIESQKDEMKKFKKESQRSNISLKLFNENFLNDYKAVMSGTLLIISKEEKEELRIEREKLSVSGYVKDLANINDNKKLLDEAKKIKDKYGDKEYFENEYAEKVNAAIEKANAGIKAEKDKKAKETEKALDEFIKKFENEKDIDERHDRALVIRQDYWDDPVYKEKYAGIINRYISDGYNLENTSDEAYKVRKAYQNKVKMGKDSPDAQEYETNKAYYDFIIKVADAQLSNEDEDLYEKVEENLRQRHLKDAFAKDGGASFTFEKWAEENGF